MSRIATALRGAPADRRIEARGPNRVRMICPNEEHAGGHERTPSFWVWTAGPRAGQGKCYGCGMTAEWRDVVRLLGLPRSARFLTTDAVDVTVSDEEAARMLGRSTRATRASLDDLPWPTERTWRGVDGAVVRAVGGTLVPSRRGPAMLRLPVTVRHERVGHVDCALEKPTDGSSAYLNSLGTGTGGYALYPYDWVRDHAPRAVAVVEGPRDALVTIQNGCMALAALGVDGWNRRTARLLRLLQPEIVIVMADPDEAGEHLRRSVHAMLGAIVPVHSVVLPSEIVTLPDGTRRRRKLMDPADLTPRTLERALRAAGLGRDQWHHRLELVNPTQRPSPRHGRSS